MGAGVLLRLGGLDGRPGGREAAQARARREDSQEHRRIPGVPLVAGGWAGFGVTPRNNIATARACGWANYTSGDFFFGTLCAACCSVSISHLACLTWG